MTDQQRPTTKRTRNRLKRTGSSALGDRIRKFRVKLGVSQVALAQQLGRSEGWLIQVENGRADPGYGDLLSLASALKRDISELLPAEGNSAPATMPSRDYVDDPSLSGSIDDERLSFVEAYPHQLDGRSIDDLAALTRLYAGHAQSMAPTALLAAVAALMRRLRILLAGSQTASVRRRLQALYAENAAMAGRLAFWSDDRGQAEHLLSWPVVWLRKSTSLISSRWYSPFEPTSTRLSHTSALYPTTRT